MSDFVKKTTQRRAEIMLLAATFFWGWTFPVVKDAVTAMPVFAFLALRFALAGCMMAVLLRRLPRRRDMSFGLALGGVLFLIFAFQTWGLTRTSSANSAFITGLNVIWVFLFLPGAWRQAWPQMLLVGAGLWLLTPPDEPLNLGDFLTLICSLGVALHILMLARRHEAQSSGDLAAMQFWTVAIISAAVSYFTEESLLPPRWDGEIIFALLLTAGGATVFSFWAQTHFQRRTSPLRAGLIFICEPIFAAIFAWGVYAETLPSMSWLGALLILAAMVRTVLQEAKKMPIHPIHTH